MTNDSPVIQGYETCNNYMEPHLGMEGKTPADMTGVEDHNRKCFYVSKINGSK